MKKNIIKSISSVFKEFLITWGGILIYYIKINKIEII